MKKILSLVLICAMSISCVSLARAEYKDILPDAPYEEEIDIVTGLGLMTAIGEESFSPKNYVSRAEFMEIVAPLMGIDGVLPRRIFADVSADSPYAAAITGAYDLGIISGDAESFFCPDRYITYNEAVKIMMHILGYELHAQKKGGYPEGYMLYARRLGLTGGISLSGDGYISRGEIAMLLVNSFDITVYSLIDNNTLLNERLRLYTAEGRMTKNSRTTLNGEGSVQENIIAIEFEDYKTDRIYDQFIGSHVVCYYEIENGDKKVKYIHSSKRNEVTSVSKEIITKVDGSTVTFRENGKARKITIPTDAYVIYNHFSYVNYPADVFDITTGELKLLDNNRDGKIDVVFVNEYTNSLLKGVDTYNGRLYTVGEVIEIDYDKKQDMVIDGLSGKALKIEEVPTGKLVSIFKNNESGNKTVYINHGVAEGIIEEMTEDTVLIGGKEYKCSIIPSLKEKLGTNVKLYLDYAGVAVMIDDSYRTVVNYGYILDAENGWGRNNQPQLQIMTQEGKVVTYETPKKVTLDGVKIESKELITSLQNRTINDPNPVDPSIYAGNETLEKKLQWDKPDYYTDGLSMLIAYTLNSEGQINEIDTPYCDSSKEDGNSVKLSGRYPNGVYQGVMNYRTATRIFMGAFGVENDAKIFFIPETLDARKEYSDDLTYDFGVKQAAAYLKNDTNYPQGTVSMIEAYNFNDLNVSDVLVFYSKVPEETVESVDDEVSKNYTPIIIERIVNAVMPNGDWGMRLTGTGNSGKITLTMTETFYNRRKDKLKVGNVIAYDSVGGQLTTVKLLHSPDVAIAKQYTMPSTAWGYREPSDATAFGQVVNCDNDFILLRGPRGGDGEICELLYELSYVYIYNKENEEVRIGSASDIRSYNDILDDATDVFIYTSYGETRFMVIYE